MRIPHAFFHFMKNFTHCLFLFPVNKPHLQENKIHMSLRSCFCSRYVPNNPAFDQLITLCVFKDCFYSQTDKLSDCTADHADHFHC